MPPRSLTPALLWLALGALLVLAVLLLAGGVHSPFAAAELAITVLLLGLTGWALRTTRHPAATAPVPATPPPPPPDSAARVAQADQVAQVAQVAQAQTRFLAQISHEIRTPMNAVLGMTQLALQTPLSAEQRDLLTKADASARALLGLVVDALDVARIEAGQSTIDGHPLRLEDVVAQALDQVRPLHGNPAVALVCDWADASLLGPRGQLLGDASRLQQLMVNLMGQALRYTADGQVLLRLAADPSDAQGHVPLRITVQDSGQGLSSPQLEALQREGAEPLTPHPLGGASLGLSLARRLTELMGGRFDVQSQPGRGSSFEAHLRLAPNPQATLPAPLAPQRLLLAAAPTPGQEATLALLRHLGQGEGLAASDSAQATLDAIAAADQQGHAFDWLLLDWRLPGPGPTGADLLAQLRRDQPGLRIAVLSSPGAEGDPGDARAFGARSVCHAPLTPGDLRRLLGAVSSEAPAERATASDTQALAGLRVLLVEDHPINQEIAVRMLGSRGARLDVASNGQEGLDRLQAQGPQAYDLVLMDLEMPVLDGLAATRRLREMPAFDRLPVLAMTAHVLPEEKAQCLAAGMQGHIAKPLNVRRLVRELQRFLPAAEPDAALPVLDQARGLRQFDGQAALYRRTLLGFVEQYADGLAHWPDWLARADWPQLHRAAHTLQGLAATLGAGRLQAAAQALERSAMLTDAQAAPQQLVTTQAALQQVLTEAAAALTSSAETPSPAVANGPADLGELRQLLAQNDSRALDWWQAHAAASGLEAGAQQQVTAALNALDFDAAAAALGPVRPGDA